MNIEQFGSGLQAKGEENQRDIDIMVAWYEATLMPTKFTNKMFGKGLRIHLIFAI